MCVWTLQIKYIYLPIYVATHLFISMAIVVRDLSRVTKYGLKFKSAQNCILFCASIQFRSHTVAHNGLIYDLDKIMCNEVLQNRFVLGFFDIAIHSYGKNASFVGYHWWQPALDEMYQCT